jgi:hypothetical protein
VYVPEYDYCGENPDNLDDHKSSPSGEVDQKRISFQSNILFNQDIGQNTVGNLQKYQTSQDIFKAGFIKRFN